MELAWPCVPSLRGRCPFFDGRPKSLYTQACHAIAQSAERNPQQLGSSRPIEPRLVQGFQNGFAFYSVQIFLQRPFCVSDSSIAGELVKIGGHKLQVVSTDFSRACESYCALDDVF